MEAPYSTMMSRSIAACFSPTSTWTPAMLAAPVPPPGMRSRIAPNARDTPPPMAWTPEISRAAMPAIFCTTDAAIVVRPWPVSSATRAGEPAVVVPAAAPRVVAVVDVLVVDGVASVIVDSSRLLSVSPGGARRGRCLRPTHPMDVAAAPGLMQGHPIGGSTSSAGPVRA